MPGACPAPACSPNGGGQVSGSSSSHSTFSMLSRSGAAARALQHHLNVPYNGPTSQASKRRPRKVMRATEGQG